MSDRNWIRWAGPALALALPLVLGGCNIVGDVASSTVSGVADGTKTVVSWFQGGGSQQTASSQPAAQPSSADSGGASMPPPAAAPAAPVQSAPLAAPAPVQQQPLN